MACCPPPCGCVGWKSSTPSEWSRESVQSSGVQDSVSDLEGIPALYSLVPKFANNLSRQVQVPS